MITAKVVESSKWLTLVVENVNEIEWLKLLAVIVDFSLCWVALLLFVLFELENASRLNNTW